MGVTRAVLHIFFRENVPSSSEALLLEEVLLALRQGLPVAHTYGVRGHEDDGLSRQVLLVQELPVLLVVGRGDVGHPVPDGLGGLDEGEGRHVDLEGRHLHRISP